jgi:hypothetical protein
MSYIGELSWFHYVSTYGKEVIEYLLFEDSFKLKLTLIGEFKCTLDILKKPSVREILNFE